MRSVSRFSRLAAAALLVTSLQASVVLAGEREPRDPGSWLHRLVTKIVHVFGDEISIPPHS